MNASTSRAALLIVDMQVGLFRGAERPYDGERVLQHIQRLIEKARQCSAPILAARHTGAAGSPIAVGAPAWQLLPELGLDPARDIVFNKSRPSCFYGTGLAHRLAELGVDELVVTGMKTQYCIDTTCRVASELGIQPVLVADAHTCMDTSVASAQQIIAHHNLTLGGAFARLTTADALTL